ncbi:MAG: hypothetical protein K6A61_09545 [Butyrivibrio sp.]|nr:hypothetical protein [Butyrivibrio sp.]
MVVIIFLSVPILLIIWELVLLVRECIDNPFEASMAVDGLVFFMLRQNVLLPLAMSKAMELLINNPFAGEMYDGDLLKQVVNVMKNHGVTIDKRIADQFIELASKEKKTFECEFVEDKADYEELLDDFRKMQFA